MSWTELHEILTHHDHVVGWEWLRDENDRPSVFRIFWANGEYEDVTDFITAAEAVRDKALGYPWLPEGRED
jgi:hypothetical protein